MRDMLVHIDIVVCMRAVSDRHRDIVVRMRVVSDRHFATNQERSVIAIVCMRAVSDRHARVAGGDSVFNEPLMFCLKKLSFEPALCCITDRADGALSHPKTPKRC